jgi:F-type H+-transporting ATPase subunit a
MFIIMVNVVALYPQVLSVSSHICLNFPMSLTFWLALIIFGWTVNTNKILSHLVPQGTPNVLIVFMVLIELVRNIIRPVTLCVRLTANLIAGHLLISLLGSALVRRGIIVLFFVPILLTILEIAVSFIQAYVFITLITLYTTEIK